MFEQVVDWVCQLEAFFKDHPFPSHTILNYDECRIVTNGERLAFKRVQSADRERANVLSTSNNTIASRLTFMAASCKRFFERLRLSFTL